MEAIDGNTKTTTIEYFGEKLNHMHKKKETETRRTNIPAQCYDESMG